MRDQKMIDHCNHSPADLLVSSSISCVFLKQVSDHINLSLKNLPELPVTHLPKHRPLTQGTKEVPPQCIPSSHFFLFSPSCLCRAKLQPNEVKCCFLQRLSWFPSLPPLSMPTASTLQFTNFLNKPLLGIVTILSTVVGAEIEN